MFTCSRRKPHAVLSYLVVIWLAISSPLDTHVTKCSLLCASHPAYPLTPRIPLCLAHHISGGARHLHQPQPRRAHAARHARALPAAAELLLLPPAAIIRLPRTAAFAPHRPTLPTPSLPSTSTSTSTGASTSACTASRPAPVAHQHPAGQPSSASHPPTPTSLTPHEPTVQCVRDVLHPHHSTPDTKHAAAPRPWPSITLGQRHASLRFTSMHLRGSLAFRPMRDRLINWRRLWA